MEKLLNAIVRKLDDGFADYKKYLFEPKEGFERPSFFIHLISNKQTIVNKSIYNQNIIVRITYLDILNESNKQNKLTQAKIGEKLLSLFSSLSIYTDRKSIKIIESFLGFDDDGEVYLQITFEDFKSIKESFDDYELMETIELET